PHAFQGSINVHALSLEAFHECLRGFFFLLFDVVDFDRVLDARSQRGKFFSSGGLPFVFSIIRVPFSFDRSLSFAGACTITPDKLSCLLPSMVWVFGRPFRTDAYSVACMLMS
ncbi:hypothetical protein Tco_0460696, partial [Tanacetum coccineum]